MLYNRRGNIGKVRIKNMIPIFPLTQLIECELFCLAGMHNSIPVRYFMSLLSFGNVKPYQ